MKKKKNFLTIIGILFLIILLDLSLVLIFKTRPLFAISGDIYRDGGSKEYYGIGYKVLKCKTLSGDNTTKIGFYNMPYSCKNSNLEEKTYKINDDIKIIYIEKKDNEIVLPVIYQIYQDDEYLYFINYTAQAYVKHQGNQITYSEALNKKLITIDDLIKIGVKIFKEKKEIEDNNNIDNTVDTSKCSFTRTFKVINILDYQSQDNETKFLVVDFFQGGTPFIIKTKLNTNNLIKNQYYEFTFDGFKKNYINEYNLILFDVIKTEKTNKVGFNQTNESCN